MTAGNFHSLFLKNDGSLWAMGYNLYGQLGNGTNNSLANSFPIQIVPNGVTAVAGGLGGLGGTHSLFIKSDGSLWGMGNNAYGQLGTGTYVNTNRPQQILIASTVTNPPPVLGISTYQNQPMVFFPTATGTNYVLQMTTNLTLPNWVNVMGGISISGVQVTNAPSTAFFRLH